MIRTVIFDIGNVLAGFSWEEHFKNLGYDGEMTQRLARNACSSLPLCLST